MSLTGRIEYDKEFNEILDMFDYTETLDKINKYDYKTDLKIKRKLSNMYLYSYLGYESILQLFDLVMNNKNTKILKEVK